MNLGLQRLDQWVVVFVEGRLDSLNYDLIEFRLKTLMRMGQIFIALELSKATFMNIATLALAVSTAKSLRASNGAFAVIAANREIRTNLEGFGGRDLTFFDSLDNLRETRILPTSESTS